MKLWQQLVSAYRYRRAWHNAKALHPASYSSDLRSMAEFKRLQRFGESVRKDKAHA